VLRQKDNSVWLPTRCVCLMFAVVAVGATGTNWPAWRGPEGIGGEKMNASLAVSNGEIFLRTYSRLWCVGER
jgi:hypothetical protein